VRRDAQAVRLALQAMEKDHVRRRRRTIDSYPSYGLLTHVVVEGQELVNFCSNDYLGLARDSRLAEATTRAAQQFGAGSGASHLVTGHTREHAELEAELADFTHREAALLFSTGYMANLGLLSSLVGRGDVVLEDRLNHASLIDGALLSGARLSRYAHGSVADAAKRLEKAEERDALIATDGVFSMDGDVAPLAPLAELARQAHAWFVVDDAHGIGVTGPEGRGSVAAAGLDADAVPLLMGTLGKAFGSVGAFVAGPRELLDFIVQRARSYIYTTALPPPVAAASRAALRIVREEPWRRERLGKLVTRFRAGAAALKLPLMPSATPIQPLLLEDSAVCLAASQRLRERGFWVAAIRPPTVPLHTARLRVTLSAAHEETDVDALLAALAEVLRNDRAAAS
jgi:8-amino-7-oxononanoate synthase